jgi:RNA polymerase sigma-70 factor (ECF subfamily)
VVAASVLSFWTLPRFAFLAQRGSNALVWEAVHAAPRAKPFTAARSTEAKAAAPAPREPDRATIDRFSTLMLPHLDAAYSFARYLTRGGDSAEDVVHDALARALNAFSAYRGGDAKAWLLTIVRNCFITSVRRRSEISASDKMPEIADDADTPEAALARSQTSKTMRRLIKALPDNLAEVIVLREVEELSYKEIAAIIDAPIGTVMSRLARAREALARAWRDEVGEGGA